MRIRAARRALESPRFGHVVCDAKELCEREQDRPHIQGRREPAVRLRLRCPYRRSSAVGTSIVRSSRGQQHDNSLGHLPCAQGRSSRRRWPAEANPSHSQCERAIRRSRSARTLRAGEAPIHAARFLRRADLWPGLLRARRGAQGRGEHGQRARVPDRLCPLWPDREETTRRLDVARAGHSPMPRSLPTSAFCWRRPQSTISRTYPQTARSGRRSTDSYPPISICCATSTRIMCGSRRSISNSIP